MLVGLYIKLYNMSCAVQKHILLPWLQVLTGASALPCLVFTLYSTVVPL